jgi:dienelactone hydrolase
MKTMKLLTGLVVAGAVLVGCASGSKTRAAYEYRETSVLVDAGDYQIPAIVTLPVGVRGTVPAVVMLHGFGSTKDEAGDGYKLFAPELAQKGIASIRIDFMGLGDSTVDHAGFDLNVGVAEAAKAAEYIAALPEVDPARIGIMGWSKGGSITLLTAGRNPVFKSVVTWAGAPDLSGAVYTAEGYEAAKRGGVYVYTFDWREPLNLSRNAFEVAANTDILAEFARSAAPVLAIAGSNDDVVPPENAGRIKAASPNGKSRVFIIPEADHTFNIFSGDMSAFTILSKETINWFLETL